MDQAPLHPIRLKQKQLNAFGSKENRSIVCSKCILPNEKSLNDLKWWFQINRQLGHKLIDVCNPLGNSSLLNEIVKIFGSDFVRIRELNCFPNLNSDENVNQTLFRSYDQYIASNSHNKHASPLELYRRMDILNEVVINECYFDHIDTYR